MAAKLKFILVLLLVLIASLGTECNVAHQNSSSPNQLSTIGKASANTSDDNAIEDSSSSQADLEQFWLNQRDQFFNQTIFKPTKVGFTQATQRSLNS